jgi:UDP-glucose 4-epimerase
VASLVAEALRREGHSVTVFSRTASDGLRPLHELGPGFDWVLHCGWNCVPFTAEQNTAEAESGNLPVLENLVARSAPAKILFMSSGAVYGETGPVPADESREPSPLGAYARGKLVAERFLTRQAADRLLVVRVSNLLLPLTSTDHPQGVLPRMVAAVRKNLEFQMWGDGQSTKDYLAFEDFASGISALIQSDAEGIFNLGSGESLPLIDIVRLVEEVAEKPVRLRFLPHFDWDVIEARIDISAISLRTGWRPARPLREAIVRCVEELL